MAPELVTCYISALAIFQVEIVFEVGFKCSSSRIWGSFDGIYQVAHPVALTVIEAACKKVDFSPL